ncbi:AsmA family protein [Reichenbachiella agarivorans]|uniref:AsmA family protein n=1 Tax=Reichenbachiella agarivorans TaxID=2979464 RepID=A0ABY6CTX5_9BACT|nr:AsmA-like C-terminal region-containing protein [Reichenbachiella agarivorans]UXP33329.1 AsmA family protein [Reichenbachiella agarivorans]
MKKLLIILGSLFAIIIALLVLIPIIFKDDIKQAVDDAIAENINAKVYYDEDGFSLSLIKNFPNFTLGIDNFGIVGKAPFEKDTLLSVAAFAFEIDVMSVIKGEKIQINSILLDQPEITVLVLPDGTANYDIAIANDEVDTVAEDTTAATAFNIAIKKWEIKDANIVYIDQSMQITTTLLGLNHSGSGDFTQDIFDLTTTTNIMAWSMSMEGVDYLSSKSFDADITLSMDLPNAKYTFKENKIAISDFVIGLDGYVAMPGEDIDMDLTFGGQDISIKSILSLIPGVYQEYLTGVETSGNITFEGTAKGIYNDKRLPDVTASLNVDNGKVKYADYPIPIEKLTIKTKLNVPGENMDNMTFAMPVFSMLLDGETVTAKLFFSNLKNYTWDFAMNGSLDLEKLLKVVPIDGMNLKGLVTADFSTSGNMKMVDEERYDEIPAEGSLALKGFEMISADLPQGFSINKTSMTFSPRNIALKEFDAKLGRSDIQMNGNLSNFIAYALSEDAVLQGNLNFTSNTFDLDEWMTEEEEVVVDTTSAALEVIRIPTNLDFVLVSKINTILYDSMVIKDLDGLITVREGIAKLNNVDFNLLDGEFTMNGTYNSAKEQPYFDFGFNIKDLSIPKSYETFNTVKKLAPVAKNITGKFSADLTVSGNMGSDMMPIYEHLNGKGVIQIGDAALKGDNLMKAVSAVSKFSGDEIAMKDLKLKVEIKEGRLYVDPFDVSMQGQKATVYGSNGIDGSLDYNINTLVKTGAAGEAVNSMLAQYTGGKNIIGETMLVKLKVGGTYEKPKVSIAGTESAGGQSPQAALKDAAKAEIDKQIKAAEEQAKAELEKQKKIAEQKAKEEIDKQKAAAEKAAEEAAKKAAEDAKKKAVKSLKKMF